MGPRSQALRARPPQTENRKQKKHVGVMSAARFLRAQGALWKKTKRVITNFEVGCEWRSATLQLVSCLHFQHRPLSFTGSLGVGCESLLKVKVKDSVGLRPYSQLECSAAQLTESKGKGQCGPRRELRVKVKTSKTPRRPTRQPTTTTDSQPGPCHMRRN